MPRGGMTRTGAGLSWAWRESPTLSVLITEGNPESDPGEGEIGKVWIFRTDRKEEQPG